MKDKYLMTKGAVRNAAISSNIILSMLFLSGCQTAEPSKAPEPLQPIAFKPEYNGKQCTPESMAGKWNRFFSPKYSYRGTAVWRFLENGTIQCQGEGCLGAAGQPKTYSVKEVFAGTEDTNIGLVVRSDAGKMTTTCEIVGNMMQFGSGYKDGGLTFERIE